MPLKTAWEILNDLIAHGVDRHVFDIAVKEMHDMFLIMVDREVEDKDTTVSLLNPAVGDIAYDVCTPEQIDSICMAILDRVKSMQEKDFRVPFLMANFHSRLEDDALAIISLWKKGYSMLLKSHNEMLKSSFYLLLELIDEEIKTSGYDTERVLGKDFFCLPVNEKPIEKEFLFIHLYNGPIATGPMGHTLSVISRSIIRQVKIFRKGDSKESEEVLGDLASAAQRYCKEVFVIENFLELFGMEAKGTELEVEIDIIMELAIPSKDIDVAISKAALVLNELILRHVESRRKRLLEMFAEVRNFKKMPRPILEAEPAIRRAFELFLSKDLSYDGAHEALMVLAVNHWKPRLVPEKLPVGQRQTLAKIRNRVLVKSNDPEPVFFRHQQGPDDLGAFLVVAPLLYQDAELKAYYR